MPTLYPWERRWLEIAANKEVNESYHQVESDGYVAASVTIWKEKLETEPIGILLEEVISERQVVVLLGEPGSGKSSEWRKLRSRLEADAQHLFLNLGAFASEDELREDILKDPKVEAWHHADYKLTLWLDSLDEGLLHMRKLQPTLERILRKLRRERLHLRITCRNAVWPVAFTEELGGLWQFGPQPTSEQLSLLLLRPLTRQQIAEAAQEERLAPEQFLAAVAELDAQPLASIPVTLRLLLSLYKKHQPGFGVLESAGRAGLYERGCLQLCDAPDEGRDGRPDGRQRLLLASYLAYLAVFSNRRQIHIEPVKDELGENALDPYAAGAGLTVLWQGLRATISPAAIQDLLKNTSLFTDLGNGCLAWVHQAFAEFLAAWYLNLTNVSTGSLRALFRSEADPAGGVVPALRETAAWLAELQPEFWQELLRLDPLALVRGDLRRLRDEQRAAVVQQLATVMGTLAYPPYLESRERSFMQQLWHPGLAAQLEPLLTYEDVSSATVRFAMDMAKGCRVQGIIPMLTKQALDVTQPFYKRAHALDILRDIMPDEAKSALRPLIHCIPAEDERDEFRGDLLWTLWPAHLGPDELLPLLTPEKDDHYMGAYGSFIIQLEKAEVLFSAISVQACLDWLSQNWSTLEEHHRLTTFWRRLSWLVWQRALQLITEPGVYESMAAAYAASTEHHEQFSMQEASDDTRLALLSILLARHYKRTRWGSVVSTFSQQKPLIIGTDWDRLLSLIYSRMSFGQREWLANIMCRLLADSRYGDSEASYCQRYEQFHTAARKYASVRVVRREWFKPTVLQSEIARFERKSWLQGKKRQRKDNWRKHNRRRVALRKVGQQARFMRWLVQYEVDRVCRQWSHVLDSFRFDKTGKNSSRYQPNLGQSKRWKRLAPGMKAQVLDKLWGFITQHSVPPTAWYEPGNHTTYGSEVLREGLVLIFSQREPLVRSQPSRFWQDLASFLVRFDESADEGIRHELLHLAAIHAPQEIDSAIALSMDARDYKEHGSFSRFEDWYQWLPTARFPALLLQGIEFGVWNEELSAQVLTAMLEVNYAPAWEYVQELLSVPAGKVIERPKLVVKVFGSLLFRKANYLPNVWQYWEWVSNHLDIARLVIDAEINHPSPSEFIYLTGLAEEELETLALWLTYAFSLLPTDVDDWRNNNSRGKYAGLRTAAVAELAARGTVTAWRTLEQLNEHLGRPFWIKIRLDQVRENLRRNAWVPVSPGELIEMSQQASKRLIKSATDLQELVLDSLRRFQADLHNELAVANTLWIPQKKGNKQVGHEVRDENFLSDVLRLYLDKDLRRPEVLIKREVEIRKSIGAGTGQRTDLFIDAFSRDEKNEKTEVVTVVVEVKLAKNKETETALEGQLLPYLVDQHYKHGIYLIGWHYGQYDLLPTGKKDLPALFHLLRNQTATVSNAYSIRTLIMDIRLPADNARSKDAACLFEAI
jgi:hypothetical protein